MLTLKKAAESRATHSLMNRVSSSRMTLRLIRQQISAEAKKSLQWLQNLATVLYDTESRLVNVLRLCELLIDEAIGDQSTHCSGHSIDWLIDWMIDWVGGWLIGWLIGYL